MITLRILAWRAGRFARLCWLYRQSVVILVLALAAAIAPVVLCPSPGAS